MKKFIVTGMSCAACQTRVEKSVSKISNVKAVSVSLLTNSMQVDGNFDDKEVIEAVEKAGYGVSLADEKDKKSVFDEDSLKDKETPKLRKRFLLSLVFLIPLMYVSMGHMMWGWPLPKALNYNFVALAMIQMLFTIIILIINQKFFISGTKGFFNKSPNMDTLVALGAGASFLYSTYVLFLMTNAQMLNDNYKVAEYMHDLYFESAAMIVTLITLGKMLEAYSKGKTTNALKGLMNLAPKTAVLIIRDKNGNESEKEVAIEKINIGDVFIVKPGESIPVDGIVIEGESAVDESALTGESIPVDKIEGSTVSSATINQSGFLKCRAVRVGENTTLSQIVQMVSDAATTKAPIAKVADKVSGIFVPVVILIAAVTIIVWLIVGENMGFALARGISVLVISCPCALGLATPVAIMVGSGVGAKNGILFKNASALENTGKTGIIAMDKTGTITQGKPQVTDIIADKGVTEKDLLEYAYSLELKSEHPLAAAIIKYAEDNNINKSDVTGFKAEIGNGLTGDINDEKIIGGNLKFVSTKVEISKNIIKRAEEVSNQGKTPLFFAKNNSLLGIIAVADIIKKESRETINDLKNMGIKVIMLTGDNKKTAEAIGKESGVNEVIADMLPQDKERFVRELSQKDKTIMVGDGINDAPALTRADIGIAIGAGCDIAIDAADVVLMKDSLPDVPASIRLGRSVLKNIHQNLFWAFIYNVIGIPLAAGVWYPIFGWKLNPMFGAAAMSLSSFCVVTNALRLNFIKIYSKTKDRKIRQSRKLKNKDTNIKEIKEMKKTMKINGMMCSHCEAAVKKALESLSEVDEAIVSHEDNQAVVKLNSEISDELLRKTVEDKDYTVESIQ